MREDTKAHRLVVETTRLKQELKMRELAVDFLKKQSSSDRDAINKELVRLSPGIMLRVSRRWMSPHAMVHQLALHLSVCSVHAVIRLTLHHIIRGQQHH